jgi:PAS domain S-box-containing protein
MGSQPSATVPETGDRETAHARGGPDPEFFRCCFGHLPDPVIVFNLQSLVVFLNHSAQILTGHTLSKETPLICSDFLRSGFDSAWDSLVEQCLHERILDGVQVYLRNFAGDWLPFSLSGQLATDRDDNPAGIVIILRGAVADSTQVEKSTLGPIFSSVINNFPMAFFTVDTDLTVTYMNDHLEKLTGYPSSEVVKRMTCAEMLQTPECNTCECSIKQAMESRKPISGLRRTVLDRKGRKIPVAMHASMITDSSGKVIGGFEAIRDITSVAEAEQKIRMLIEVTQEGILMVDENDRVIYANAKMAEIFEQPKDELIGKDVSKLLPFQHLSITHDLLQKVDSEHPQHLRFCTTIQPGSASREYQAFETCIVVSRVGKSVITCMYFHDLTKHIEIERQLYEANSFLNNIIMSSADGIVVADTAGKILIFNESAERILGYSAEEVIGTPGALAKVASLELAKEIMRRMRSDEYGPPGKVTSTRITLVRKDGEEVPVNFSAAIIEKNGREIGSVGIFSDLRERLRIRRELEEARSQLIQAEKIASVGRLAAGVAHEINNPLSGILMFADLLMRDLSHNEQWGEDLQEIIDQTLRCKQIVNRLLDFSRQSVGQRLSLDINTIIDRSAELLAHQSLFHDVEFVMDLQPDIPEMTGDPGQLQQVFTNLIINAGTAMNGKGKVEVSSRFDPVSEQIILQFVDTGPGIPPDIISKIFEPFFTTKGPGEGTGLGLSVAYGIIQQHGGSIGVKNAFPSGARFTIILPLECPEPTKEFTC